MTDLEAEGFLSRGHADADGATGWRIAHEIAGEFEWFSVTEADGQVLDRVARRLGLPDSGPLGRAP